MEDMFGYATVFLAILLSVMILIQSRGASLGAGFGGSSEIHTTRRGVDKSLHQATVVISILFVLSIASGLLFSV
jgi:preprotein translocase subunit SecG